MTQKANYFKLGLFVIIASLLGAVFLIVFGAGQFFKKELLAETCFNESVQGLSIGSEVKYKGIKIGSVKSISSAAQIYKTKSDYVLVVLAIDDKVSLGQTGDSTKNRINKAIQDGLTIQLAFKGLTGAAYLETDYTDKAGESPLNIPWSPENTYIPSRQSSIKQFGESISQILDNLTAINIKGITTNIDTLLTTIDQKINSFDVKHISAMTTSLLEEIKLTNKNLNSTIESDKIKNIINDAKVSFSQLRSIIEDSKKPLKTAIIDFQKTVGNTEKLTAEFEGKLGSNIEGLSSNLDKFMKNLASTSEMLENMVWINSDKIKLIIENFETTSENLKQLSKDIKKYPGRLFFEEPPPKLDLETNNSSENN
ncbi:MCE family protein [bacterium]|nr:MCE family protein [bacterium]